MELNQLVGYKIWFVESNNDNSIIIYLRSKSLIVFRLHLYDYICFKDYGVAGDKKISVIEVGLLGYKFRNILELNKIDINEYSQIFIKVEGNNSFEFTACFRALEIQKGFIPN